MKKITPAFIILIFFFSIGVHGQTATNVVISQIYGGGGNTGAPFQNDYIELFNPTNSVVNLAGWSLQYGSATGTSWTGITPLTGIIAANSYYLVREAAGAGNGSPLPTPDDTASIAMSSTAGKVALCNSITALTGQCPTGGAIIDFVGYGSSANCFEGATPTPGPSNTNAIFRADSSCTDADNNATDFSTAAPNPRNSASSTHTCGPTSISENASLQNLNIIAYPNPVHDILFVSSSAFINENIDIQIFNMLGTKIFVGKTSSKTLNRIDVSGFTDGIYFVRLQEGKNMRTVKFVKQ
ncbi:MAG: lamin tail domain-containing protein [Bacteroidia bacterium]|nr:lamin tail domain-containing protein [Bacteroidia bacterium]